MGMVGGGGLRGKEEWRERGREGRDYERKKKGY
jgi:hypothetical protein